MQLPTYKKQILPALALIGLMAFSLGLQLYNIQSLGNANEYYTAAVKAMTQSFSNFFFVAAEPGGSVSVDKPPLGLWIEAIFGLLFGVNGISTSMPNILAGVFSIPVLYFMVKKYTDEWAGLLAGLVMAISPIFLAANRNNTMDGMLTFSLLLAAWAFLQAAETGRARWLILGAVLIGLGFNIKMLQAFLPLPAFYALYFLASREGWLRKTVQLGLATLVMIAVSFSWAVTVDLIPASMRPYVGSSDNNTVLGLITGHNGASRLANTRGGPNGPQNSQGQQQPGQPLQGPPQEALQACQGKTQGDPCSFSQPNRNSIEGACITPPNSSQLACAPQGMGMNPGNQRAGAAGPQGGTPFSQETGEPGILRFFTQPLSKQMSWLLPFALVSLLLSLLAARIQLPLESNAHKALVLWGGWLVTCLVFFSMVSGIFHAYYTIMLTPALGAVVALGFYQFRTRTEPWIAPLYTLAIFLTLAFELFALWQYGTLESWLILVGALFGLGLVLMGFTQPAARTTLLCAILIVPLYWSWMTVSNQPENNLPSAYSGQVTQGQRRPGNFNGQAGGGAAPRSEQSNLELINYLQENTQGVKFMLAVPSSHQGASLVIATGRPVLYMGGFGGQDQVISAEGLQALVKKGELRYILYGDERGNKQEIASWLNSACQTIPEFNNFSSGGPGNQGSMKLYECR